MRGVPLIWFVMAMVLCSMTAFRGSKVTITLFAIELGAPKVIIGVLVALYSLFPMLLALYAGRLVDRMGVARPVVMGACGLAIALILPYLFPSLPALYVQAAGVGAAHVFYNIAIQNLIGALGTAEDRTRNFANFALAMSMGGLVGPLVAGFAIDHWGYASSYLLLSAFPLVPVVVMLSMRALREARTGVKKDSEDKHAGASGSHVFDLLRNPPLRRTLITGAVILTATDLFHFYLPIYGHSIGLSASVIGIVLSVFSSAAFVVRACMPTLVKRMGEEHVLRLSIFAAAAVYCAMPFVNHAVLLIALAFALGLSTGCGQPLSLSLIYSRAPKDRSGETLGLRMTINNFTHIVTPLLFSVVGTAMGVAPVFLLNAFMLASGGVILRKK